MKKVKSESTWVKAERRSDKSQTGSEDESTKEIEQALKQKKWKKAQALILRELPLAPTDHWLWLSLSLAHYEEENYQQALECSMRAVALQPSCPLALWHYAGSLFMNHRESDALAIWTIIQNMELDKVAYGECGEGMDWALQLVNDVHYRIGRFNQWKGEKELACASFKKYLHNRAHGIASIYDESEVHGFLAELAC